MINNYCKDRNCDHSDDDNSDDDESQAIGDDFESRYYDLTRERLGLTYDIDFRIFKNICQHKDIITQ